MTNKHFGRLLGIGLMGAAGLLVLSAILVEPTMSLSQHLVTAAVMVGFMVFVVIVAFGDTR